MWEPMAISIIFGLMFTTVLTLGFVPVMYSLLYRVSFAGYAYEKTASSSWWLGSPPDPSMRGTAPRCREKRMLRKPSCAWLVVGVAWGCSDGPTPPPDIPNVFVANPVVYSGDEATISSDVRFDAAGARIAIGGDTLRVGLGPEPDTYGFRVPALFTGTYEARLLVEGQAVPFGLEVVGLAREPRSVAGGYQITILNLHTTDGGQAFIAEPNGSFYRTGAQGAYGLIDVFAGTYAVQIPGLIEDGVHQVKMSVPGASYRRNHVVFDYSADGTSDVRVWRTRPSFGPEESLPCGFDAPGPAQYTVAEISPSTCLSLRGGEVWRNGTERVAQFPLRLNAQFRVDPGGIHSLLVSTPPVPADEVVDWPVFDASGRVAYVLDRYAAVMGAAFSRDGSTIWIVGRTADGTWRLDALDAMTGDVKQARAFPGVAALLDVVEGRIDGRLYVASTSQELLPTLHVLAADGLTVEHSIPAPERRYSCPAVFDGGFLVPGGSDGRIHLVGAAGQDCGWWVWSFDRR